MTYKSLWTGLRNVAVSRIGASEADDVVQETVLALVEYCRLHRRSFVFVQDCFNRSTTRIAFAILRHKVSNLKRERLRRNNMLRRLREARIMFQESQMAIQIDQIKDDLWEQVVEVLTKLPPICGCVFEMRLIGLTAREISWRLDVQENHVYQLDWKARELLRKELRDLI